MLMSSEKPAAACVTPSRKENFRVMIVSLNGGTTCGYGLDSDSWYHSFQAIVSLNPCPHCILEMV
jgi:hypothetical protein